MEHTSGRFNHPPRVLLFGLLLSSESSTKEPAGCLRAMKQAHLGIAPGYDFMAVKIEEPPPNLIVEKAPLRNNRKALTLDRKRAPFHIQSFH